MPEITLILWRDIPAQVTARSGRRQARRELSRRFSEAIDMAAMRAGLTDGDAYMAEWRRQPAGACGDDLEAAADAMAASLEAGWDDARLKRAALAGGRDSAP